MVTHCLTLDGHKCRTLFDDSVRHSYVMETTIHGGCVESLSQPRTLLRNAEPIVFDRITLIQPELAGHSFCVAAYVCENIGEDVDGPPFDLVIGSLTMKQYGIRLDTERETLDLTHFARDIAEFSEYPLSRQTA